MAKNVHLTYDERLTIQKSLAEHLSFKEIDLIIGNHLTIVEKGSFDPCVNRQE